MCGIAGLFYPGVAKPVDPQRIQVMCDAIAHRGPDGEGVWTAPGVGLGHRRLAIIDLATGDQPMVSDDQRLALVFNGEIYNFHQLRRDLETCGHVFRTNSDTEVILHGYRQWGPRCVERFDGMFAFALHDAASGTLVLARDRFGVKPLYYAELPDGAVVFGSELKALLANPALRRDPDPTAIDDFMAYGYVPDDACIVAGAKKLPAGHILAIHRGSPVPAPIKWWDIAFTGDARGSAARLEEELLGLMRDAVRSRMIADVPLGAFLSGGVDSSAVVALMAEASRGPVETCSIGFDQPEYDETAEAERIARRFATNHRTRRVDAEDFGLIPTLVHHFDEPFADASALPMYRVCELARERVTVALSGDGADEAFAGYRRYRFHVAEDRTRRLLPTGLRSQLGGLGDIFPKLDWAPRQFRAKTTLQALGRSEGEAYAMSVGVTPPALRAQLYSDDMRRAIAGHRAEDRYVRAIANAPAEDALGRAQYADLKIWLPGDILTKVDRTSMAVGLEAREPLLDHHLLAFAARLPSSYRLRKGEGKWLMKRALGRYLPDVTLNRTKMGFSTPIGSWFRGPLADAAVAIGRGSALAETGWFDSDRLGYLAAEHRSGRSDHGRLLWQLLMLDRSLGHVFGLGVAPSQTP
jgi:asparagine synthase (glutamine-hydrolysing)